MRTTLSASAFASGRRSRASRCSSPNASEQPPSWWTPRPMRARNANSRFSNSSRGTAAIEAGVGRQLDAVMADTVHARSAAADQGAGFRRSCVGYKSIHAYAHPRHQARSPAVPAQRGSSAVADRAAGMRHRWLLTDPKAHPAARAGHQSRSPSLPHCPACGRVPHTDVRRRSVQTDSICR